MRFVVIVVYVDVTCIAMIGIHVAAPVTFYSKCVKSCYAENGNH